MNADSRLRIFYEPAQSYENAIEGWGNGQLWLDGQTFWFFGTENFPEPIEWIWAELLEHLACSWPFLQIESPFPYPWIARAMGEGINFWQVADDRWEESDEAIGDEEESRISAFARTHNLAAGWKGLCLPALYWYRQGHQVLLCPEGRQPIRIDYSEAIGILEQLGESMAEGMKGSKNASVISALNAWELRNSTPISKRISITTGLDLGVIVNMQGNTQCNQFWEVSEASNDMDFNANALLAAARMTSSSLPPEQIASLLERLRLLPAAVNLPELDNICEQLKNFDWQSQAPYESAYRLAFRLRNILQIEENSAFDPENTLKEWGVKIERVDLGVDNLEAIAVWGNRGPAILINTKQGMRTNHECGYRFVLAHEIAHLLIDRGYALTAAEVLGGDVFRDIEQRADAFAAELLLPRQVAAKCYRESSHLDEAVKLLAETYKVGRKLVKAQIKNSGAATPADESEIDLALSIG